MKKSEKKYINKIAYVDNKDLPGLRNLPGGHYVIIKNVDLVNKKCNVNVITSLEDKNKKFNIKRINKVKRGMIYSIPFFDSSFKLWSGINLDTVKGVNIKHIKLLKHINVKKRHLFYYRKFAK